MWLQSTSPFEDWADEEGIADEEIRERVTEAADKLYADKREKYGTEIMEYIEKEVLLRSLDQLWREHIITLEHLRQAVQLRGYGQRDPLNEYKTEGFTLFEQMIVRLRAVVTGQLLRVEVSQNGADDMFPDDEELPDMFIEDFDEHGNELPPGTVLSAAVSPSPDKPEGFNVDRSRHLGPCRDATRHVLADRARSSSTATGRLFEQAIRE